jgi:FdhD protein
VSAQRGARRAVADTRPTAWRPGPDGVLVARERPDRLAVEEPLEVRVGGSGTEPVSIAVTMRTPGHDFELAVGFCVSEGILTATDDLKSVAYCGPPKGEQRYNIVTVRLRHEFDATPWQRNVATTSSCGLCGTVTLEQVERRCEPIGPGPTVAAHVVAGLAERLRAAQPTFDRTGGLHAAGLFDVAGELEAAREDVGRHNAVDKLVGRALLDGDLPLSDRLLVVSGRVSFEILQKAALAGIPFVAAVSAPSSLAVDAARRLGVTVVGFLRDGGFNVYTGPERVVA